MVTFKVLSAPDPRTLGTGRILHFYPHVPGVFPTQPRLGCGASRQMVHRTLYMRYLLPEPPASPCLFESQLLFMVYAANTYSCCHRNSYGLSDRLAQPILADGPVYSSFSQIVGNRQFRALWLSDASHRGHLQGESLSDFPVASRTVSSFYKGAAGRYLLVQFRTVFESLIMLT